MSELEGRVAIITGAGRGIGREHALLFASEGAKVVVNDLGGETDGTGADASPAQQVVDEITAAGGTAVANHDDVSDWEGRAAPDRSSGLHVRRPSYPGQQRRDLARPHAHQHVPRGMGRHYEGASAGSLLHDAAGRRPTGARSRRPARPTREPSSTPRRPLDCSAMWARPTTERPKQGSPPSR